MITHLLTVGDVWQAKKFSAPSCNPIYINTSPLKSNLAMFYWIYTVLLTVSKTNN